MKKGFTLMELVVYMAIMGIIVVVAGQAFSNSTKFRVRTQNMLKATQEAENVATLFKADVSQMGAKTSMESGAAAHGADYGLKFYTVCPTSTNADDCISNQIYRDPDNSTLENRDSSSFILENVSTGIDKLTFFRTRYDGSGHYLGVEKVEWFVEGKKLYRRCEVIVKKSTYTVSSTDPCYKNNGALEKVEIADGVEKFHIVAASPSENVASVQVFPPCTSTPCTEKFKLIPRTGEDGFVTFHTVENSGGTEVSLSQFFSNFSNTTNGGELLNEADWKQNQAIAIKYETLSGDATWNERCNSYGKISLEKDQEYEISFEITEPDKTDKSLMFVPGEDHMSVGFRSAGTGDFLKKDGKILVDDFMFFPPVNADGSGTRSMRFTIGSNVTDACLAFTFASFSPLVSQGNITIKNLKLKKVASSNYSFETAFDASATSNFKEKKNVKALKLELQIARGGKNNKKGETGEVTIVIPTPGNGPRD